jgi:predicted SAM-dependent methyltransferase
MVVYMKLATDILGPLERGIEIGASINNPFPGINAWNVDRFYTGVFQRAQKAIAGDSADIDIVGTAQILPVTDDCVDFVLASHVLEHMPDTIRALREWDRVVKPEGIIFLIVPHKERTFDRDRPRTRLEHHLADYALRTTMTSDPLVPTSHYHVWITQDVIRLIEHLNEVGCLHWRIEVVEDVDSKVGNGFTIVARKRDRPEIGPPPDPGRIAFHQLTLKLPFQATQRTLERIVPGETLVIPPDLPRGLYESVPVFEGFPSVAGPPREIEVGEPIDPPVIESTNLEEGSLSLFGSNLTPTTWLETVFPDGTVHRILPCFKNGHLFVYLEGLEIPDVELPVTPVNLPPGEGRGPTYNLLIKK